MATPDPSLTPEKRLLQLIEGTGGDEVQEVQAPKESWISRLQARLNPEKIKGMIAETKEKIIAIIKGKEYINLHGVNQIAKGVTVLLGIYLLAALFYDFKVVNSHYIANLQVSPIDGIAQIEMSDRRIFDTDVVKNAENINVFIPPDKRYEEKKAEKTEMSLQLAEMIKDWKLAGISYYPKDEGKTFCMIEDLKKSITTFLKIGDTISGLRVQEIRQDGITLKYGDEKIELR